MPSESVPIRLSAEDAAGAWGEPLADSAKAALARAEARLGLALDAPPLVTSLAPESAFYESLGRRPHHLAAIARASENEIVINRAVFTGMDRREREATLVHEFAHLILGRRVPSDLPRWLDEGMAMVAAEEHGFTYHIRIAMAATFGGLRTLEELHGAGFNSADQELAYAQSLSATRYLLKTGLAGEVETAGDPAPLARKLADPAEGRALRQLLSDPNYLRAFERRWRASVSTFSNWIAALTGGGVSWLIISGLFLLTYWRKKRVAAAKVREWEEEDDVLASLEDDALSSLDETPPPSG